MPLCRDCRQKWTQGYTNGLCYGCFKARYGEEAVVARRAGGVTPKAQQDQDQGAEPVEGPKSRRVMVVGRQEYEVIWDGT